MSGLNKDILKIISRKGIESILLSLESGPKKFSEIMFETKLNPSIIDRHLKALTKVEVVKKNENHYALTEKGLMILHILREFRSLS